MLNNKFYIQEQTPIGKWQDIYLACDEIKRAFPLMPSEMCVQERMLDCFWFSFRNKTPISRNFYIYTFIVPSRYYSYSRASISRNSIVGYVNHIYSLLVLEGWTWLSCYILFLCMLISFSQFSLKHLESELRSLFLKLSLTFYWILHQFWFAFIVHIIITITFSKVVCNPTS